ncbi:3-isopropylmalate dehydratase small subunit [Streptomyces sp. NPDC045470]|uniref:3-isopropylmalate dehydratase small subunit n=1 Tax=unclassified Streptomyces TaxID=2593676 RepID=UPI0033CBB880
MVKSGYADALFKRWRDRGDCVIDRPEHRGATILLAGKDFGIGSSREHAVWALRDGGFLAVVATGFRDIFRRNALNNGLIPVDLPAPVIEGLVDRVEADPEFRLTVDLRARCLRWADGGADFPVDDRARRMLLEGQDAIEQTLLREDTIAARGGPRPLAAGRRTRSVRRSCIGLKSTSTLTRSTQVVCQALVRMYEARL